jgi:hypothetical protein
MQYDAQKGCRPRKLCSGNADRRLSFDEYNQAIFESTSFEETPPWVLEIIQPNIPFQPAFILVRLELSQ